MPSQTDNLMRASLTVSETFVVCFAFILEVLAHIESCPNGQKGTFRESLYTLRVGAILAT